MPLKRIRWWRTDTASCFRRCSTTNTITLLSRLSKIFSSAPTSVSCVSKATITRGNIDARRTEGNIAAVVCKRIATNTKPPIGPTDRLTSCAALSTPFLQGRLSQTPPYAYHQLSAPRPRSSPRLSDATEMPAMTRLLTRVTRAYKSFSSNWRIGVDVENSR